MILIKDIGLRTTKSLKNVWENRDAIKWCSEEKELEESGKWGLGSRKLRKVAMDRENVNRGTRTFI